MMYDEAEMKKLEINLSKLAYGMEDASGLIDYYLDLETGKIVMISNESSSTEVVRYSWPTRRATTLAAPVCGSNVGRAYG